MRLAALASAAGDRATASRHLTRVIEMDAAPGTASRRRRF